jgi:formamidopyrimidine-DNA glycosylase
MNQHILVAGVGNYLKSEILYASKISPHRKMSEIKEHELKLLYKKIIELANASLNSQGLVNRYSLADKDEQFILKVYMQKKDPLGNTVIREETKDKRTTHWVKEVQTGFSDQ